jgi:hypothetical protein
LKPQLHVFHGSFASSRAISPFADATANLALQSSRWRFAAPPVVLFVCLFVCGCSGRI